MLCEKCNNKLSKDAKFCGTCGMQVVYHKDVPKNKKVVQKDYFPAITDKVNKTDAEKLIAKEIDLWKKEVNPTKKEIDEKIDERMKAYGYFKEDWRSHYAKNRIQEGSKDLSKEGKKYSKRVKFFGSFAIFIGWLQILTIVLGMIYLLSSDSETMKFISLGYTDIVLSVPVAFIYIILGSRIKDDINKNTWRYIVFLMIIGGIFTILTLTTARPSLILFFFIYSFVALNAINKIDASNKAPTYIFKTKYWIGLLVVSILLIVGGLYLDVQKLANIGISDLPNTDKSSINIEQIDNLYRNTKYQFRIKFPEGWEQLPGDGPHVLIKAVDGTNTINIGVVEMPDEYKDLMLGLKMSEAVSLAEFETTMKEEMPNAKILSSGVTTIDDVEAYSIEYSMPYSTLDISIEGRLKKFMIYNNGFLYYITIGALKEDYDSISNTLHQSVSTFVFEDWY